MPKTQTRTVSVSILAHNPKTNRIERIVHVGRVASPATARAMLALVRRSLKEHTTRITF